MGLRRVGIEGVKMKLLFVLALAMVSNLSFADENLECPKGKVVVQSITVPDKPLKAEPAGGLDNTQVWIIISVPRESFWQEIKVQYDRHLLSLKKMREVEKRVDFWFEVVDGGHTQITVYRDYVASEIQEVTTAKLPSPQCWGYPF